MAMKTDWKKGDKAIVFTECGWIIDTIYLIDASMPAGCEIVYFDHFKYTWAQFHQMYEWTPEREAMIIEKKVPFMDYTIAKAA